MFIYQLIVSKEKYNIRIDKYISDELTNLTRSLIKRNIDSGMIKVNDKIIKSNYKVKVNDVIDINIQENVQLEAKPEDIKIDIVYEDDDLLIINKPQGMVVHPAAGNESGTLVNALLHYCGSDNLSQINDNKRPGIVHRLDKDTSGLLIVAKNNASHIHLAKQFKDRSVVRKYIAIVYAGFKNIEGVINAPIARHPVNRKRMVVTTSGGRNSITHFNVLESLKNFSYLECILETGRTHQIRVHMSYIGHPVVGDTVYGPKKDIFNIEGHALHARTIGFIHPKTKSYMEFETPPPTYFNELLQFIREDSQKG